MPVVDVGIDDATEDDAAEDAKWGLAPEVPLVGVGAPPVVAVVVTRDPGSWFEATLDSLDAQQYENLSVLVVDNGSTEDPTSRVADVLPGAFVKRLGEDRGFSGAANEVLGSVEGAPFFLFLHDDVRLAPDAVTAMVAEAFRANAGVVGAKLVEWSDPRVLSSVGLAVDPYGAPSTLVDPGELDQSQHDIARSLFAVSDACMLVRADLFRSLEGFDPAIPYFGEDVDLCWRAHVAGAAVQFCPRAVAAHRGRFEDRRRVESRARLELRHQTRTMLTGYSTGRMLRMVLVGLVLAAGDFLGSLLLARFRRCGDILAAIGWNAVHLPSLLSARRRLKRSRRVPDSSYVPLMRQGSTRLRSLVRSDDGENRLAAATRAGRGYLRGLTTTNSRVAGGLIVATVVLIALGGRELITGPLPVLREFFGVGDRSTALLAEWWNGWREVGLGEPSVPLTVVPALGTVGTVLLGSVDLARRLFVLLPLLVGAVGAWKLLVGTRSVRGRAAALALYGLSPVALNAMATGRLQALFTYAAAPWLLRRVAARAGVAPFGSPSDPPRGVLRHLAGNALILGTVAWVSPLGAALLAASVVLLAVVLALTGTERSLRMVGGAVGGLVLSSLVILPWLVESVLRGDATSLTGMASGAVAMPGGLDVFTGSVGPVQLGALGIGVLIAGLVPLITARSWRFRWALAGWVLALVSWVLTITLARADLLAGGGPQLALVPAALGLSLAVAMGPLAFEEDVMGADFGLSQVLSGLAVVALAVGLVPVAVAAADGRWYQPEGDFTDALSTVDEGTGFRTLWIGDPDVLPLSGWELDAAPGLSAGVTDGMEATVTQRSHLDGGEGVARLREAVDAALGGRTSRLGRILAPMGIRYVLVVDRPVPVPFSGRQAPLPRGTVAALQEQLDLSEIPLGPGTRLFEVAGTWPLRSDITDLELPAGGARRLSEQAALAVEPPPAVLGRESGTSFSGQVGGDRAIAQSVTADPGWTMEVDGETARRSDLFGWAQQFRTPAAGEATLDWEPPLRFRLLQLAQVVGILLLAVLALRTRKVATTRPRRRIVVPTEPLVVVHDESSAGGPPTGRTRVVRDRGPATGSTPVVTGAVRAVDVSGPEPEGPEPEGPEPEGPEGSDGPVAPGLEASPAPDGPTPDAAPDAARTDPGADEDGDGEDGEELP